MTNERQLLNRQLAQMLKGGVIMDVTTPEQARIAEEAGACAVMALERIPADIRAAGGVSAVSATSLRLRFCRPLRLIISMRVRYSLLPITYIISIRHSSTYLLCVVLRTWARPCAVLPRVLP